MKRCPQCNRVEPDETLKFCRVDGTTLISESGPVGSEVGTAKFGSGAVSSEIETSVLPHTSTISELNRGTLRRPGDKDQAFAWLNKSYENRDWMLTKVHVEPWVDNIGTDPRMADLLRCMGLNP